jgi:hypothetical protein
MKLLGIISVGFNVTDQLNRLTTDKIFCIRQILEKKNGSTMRRYISYLQTSKKPKIQLGGKYCTIFS